MKKILWLALALAVCLVTSCENLYGFFRRPSTAMDILVDPGMRFQTIHSFGASDAWVPHFVGTYWEEPIKEQIARWVFSQEFDAAGNPQGIGLSKWRFNLGAGSYEQGDAGLIGTRWQVETMPNPTRRADWFPMDDDGTLEWEGRHVGQRYFLSKAVEYGVENFLAFTISAPYTMTLNGLASATGNPRVGWANIRPEHFVTYAEYMAEAMRMFRDVEGVDFGYIAPVNEPMYNWNGSPPNQEGTPFQNQEVKRLVDELDRSLQRRNLDIKIVIPEAGSWNYLVQTGLTANRDNYIEEFFRPGSSNYIGNLQTVANIASAHSYWTYGTNMELISTRQQARAKADQFGLDLWQTEVSLLSSVSGEGIPANPADASFMDNALFLGKLIYADLVYAGVTSWSYWTTLDMEYRLKNRYLLIAVAPGVREYDSTAWMRHTIYESGSAWASPNLWVLGQYSLFVRPGFTRIRMDGADDLNGLMGTAYISPGGGRIVLVFVNMRADSVELQADFTDGRMFSSMRRYFTDENNDFRFVPATGESFIIPPRSVYTVVYD